MSSSGIRILIGVGIVAVGGAAWGFLGKSTPEKRVVPVPEPFQLKNMQAKMDQPGEMKRLFTSAAYQGLTKAQQHQVIQNKGAAYEQMWEDRLDDYFEAEEAEREAILDEHLDDLAASLNRGAKQEQGKTKKQASYEEGKGQKKSSGDWSRQERKAKSESVNPDKLARQIAYKHAMTQRADARGIDLWGGKD